MMAEIAMPEPLDRPATGTRLVRAVRAALASLGGDGALAGVAVVHRAEAAFAIRAATARAAGRSLDLQYYIWRGDLTGRLMALEVLRAADRGVAVRLLLDDVYALGNERVLGALEAHPNIAVKLFNATRWRRFGRWGLLLEIAFGGWHLNRRMHNKNWVADRALAIVGGRNIGNEYFGLDQDGAVNFRDLDLVLAGAPAAALSAVGDARGLDRLHAELEATGQDNAVAGLVRLLADNPGRHIRRGLHAVRARSVRVIADPPEKAKRGLTRRRAARTAGGIAGDIADALRSATREARLISPYFVPGTRGLALLRDLLARGVRLSVVTNALSATDVVAVHGGYMRYRRPLLIAGAELYELKPGPEEDKASLMGSRGGASLHTKALVVDGERAFVGSFNLDPRSAALNTEMGTFVNDAVVARDILREQQRLTDPALSWKVEMERGRLVWRDAAGGKERRRYAEPGASWQRTTVAWLARVLPVEGQL
jgi:putative cardiolipin synthase